MEATTVHPTQRRVACELCRKHKARCQRFHQSDPSCARCTLYGVKCTNGRQKKVGRPRPARTSRNSAVGESNSATYIPPTPPSTSPDENSILDISTYQIDWTNPGPSASTSLQVIGKAVEPTFGSSAPTWSPLELASVDNDSSSWNNGFDFAESASLFAYNSFFGASPPITDTNTSPLYLLQSPSSTVSSDPHFSPDIPKQRHASTIDDHTALMELSKINIDLHARVSAAKSNNSHLTFDDLVYRQGPLYIDKYTLAEFVLDIAQHFLQIIARVLSTRTGPNVLPASLAADARIYELLPLNHESKLEATNEPSHSPPSYHGGLREPLSTPLALMITSIFIQLLSLYELLLEHTTTRVDRLPIEPMPPIPILSNHTLSLESLCTQGAFFSRATVHVLERMQYVLGIESGPGASQKGLLTAKQIKTLWAELDSGQAIGPGQAIMGPAILQRLFGKMEIVLERIAADSSSGL